MALDINGRELGGLVDETTLAGTNSELVERSGAGPMLEGTEVCTSIIYKAGYPSFENAVLFGDV